MVKQNKIFTIRTMVKIAILTAISAIIMLFEFPLPFAPSFYELDLSDSVILMGGFAMGPLAAVVMEFLKNVLNLLLNGTITAGVGELANFINGIAFVLPSSIIYKHKKSHFLHSGIKFYIFNYALLFEPKTVSFFFIYISIKAFLASPR